MGCSDGLCQVKTYIAETDIDPRETNYIERLFYEYNSWKALISDLYHDYITLPQDKEEELKQNYFISFASHQIALRKLAVIHFPEHTINQYNVEINFDNNKLYLY